MEVHTGLTLDEIIPNGVSQTDRTMNWGVVEWNEIQSFRNVLCTLLRSHANGIAIEDVLAELRPTRKSGLIAMALENFPIGLIRMYAPQIRMTGRYLSLSDQDNIAALVRLSMLEVGLSYLSSSNSRPFQKSSRFPMEEWEHFPPSEIRSEQQLMEYFFRLLSHFGPQHMRMSVPLRLAVSTVATNYPRCSTQLAKRLAELSHTFIIIQETLYLTTSVRHRRLLYENIAPPAQPPRISRIVIKE